MEAVRWKSSMAPPFYYLGAMVLIRKLKKKPGKPLEGKGQKLKHP
jgi:hypothetical protein